MRTEFAVTLRSIHQLMPELDVNDDAPALLLCELLTSVTRGMMAREPTLRVLERYPIARRLIGNNWPKTGRAKDRPAVTFLNMARPHVAEAFAGGVRYRWIGHGHGADQIAAAVLLATARGASPSDRLQLYLRAIDVVAVAARLRDRNAPSSEDWHLGLRLILRFGDESAVAVLVGIGDHPGCRAAELAADIGIGARRCEQIAADLRRNGFVDAEMSRPGSNFGNCHRLTDATAALLHTSGLKSYFERTS